MTGKLTKVIPGDPSEPIVMPLLEDPIRLLPDHDSAVVSLQGLVHMENAEDPEHRMVLRLPMTDAIAMRLLALLQAYGERKDLTVPEV
jgi:hypothetical protein